MGYRQYFYEADKELVEKIRACQTNEEYVAVCKVYRPSIVSEWDEDDVFAPPYRLGSELFEFGKYYEGATDVVKCSTPLFTTKELQDRYLDCDAVVCTEEALLAAINWQRNKIISIYEDLILEKSSNEYDDRSQLDRMKDNARSYLNWWKFGGVSLNKDSPFLASSWLYEHTIFDLVRIYKTFDWEHKALLFMGW